MSGDRRSAVSLAADVARLLPEGVLTAAACIDHEPALRHEAERACVSRAVEKRRQEFATGRALAHELLSRLGVPDLPLLPAERRAPAWPEGVVGSISHGAGLCVVAVAQPGTCTALGLDIEGDAPLKRKLWRHILREEEQRELSELPDDEAGRRAKLVFSAKECFYKALSSQLTRVLAFEEVRLTIEDDGHFSGELLVDDAGLVLDQPLSGCWSRNDGVVLSTLAATP